MSSRGVVSAAEMERALCRPKDSKEFRLISPSVTRYVIRMDTSAVWDY
jgi:hypothetical protein